MKAANKARTAQTATRSLTRGRIVIAILVMAIVFGFAACGNPAGPEKPATYTVTFNSNGGSNVASQPIAKDGKVEKPVDPEKADWHFVGWYKDEALLNEWNFDTDTVTASITLYAKWTQTVFTVTFDSKGGSSVDSVKVGEGGKVIKPADPAKKEAETDKDMIFAGWYKDDDFATAWNFSTDTITADITLYAKWDFAVTVTFNSDGGSTVPPQTFVKGGKVTKPADPTKAGVHFMGWYKEAGFTTLWNFETDTVTEDIILYAKFAPPVTVTFNSNGGSAVPPQTFGREGRAVEHPAPTRNFAAGLYEGTLSTFAYTFGGWYNGGDKWNFSAPVTEDMTLTAQWSGGATPIAAVAANNVAAAVDYVKTNAATYTLLIDEDVNAGVQTLDTAGVNLTIMGIGAERTIQYNGATGSRLFTVSNATASLTLGNNITLNGISNSTSNVVYVSSGGKLAMKPGSKITGHTTTSGYGAVYVTGAGCTFTMEGGEISGNTSTNTALWSVGGIYVGTSAIVDMSGGAISGNYSNYKTSLNDTPADLYIANTITFTLSSAANIGVFLLQATATANASIILGGAYTGAVSALNLRGDTAITTAISWWENKTLIKAVTDYDLTANDISKFTLGQFICSTPADNRPITGNTIYDNYRIVNTGDDIGKLVFIPVDVTGVTLNLTTLNLVVGGATGTLIATVTPANATNPKIEWESSNEAVATVVNGTVTAVAKGTATIKVTTEDGGKTANCNVTVTDPSNLTVTITIDPINDAALGIADITISRSGTGYDKTTELKVTNPGDYDSIVWTISGTIFSSVIGDSITLDSANTNYNTLGKHSVTVEVTTKDGTPYSATVSFTVVE